MSFQRKCIQGLVISAFLLPLVALAQRPGEMTVFSDPGFSGSRYTVTGPREEIRIPWQVRSVIVAPGEEWQLCPNRGYRGDCTRARGSISDFRQFVASARPSDQVSTLPAPLPGGPATLPAPLPPGSSSSGPSLRGMTAEFFRAPARNGRRVISCESGGADCAAQSADRFCREQGWTASSYERQETVRGQIYLADVLCTRTGG